MTHLSGSDLRHTILPLVLVCAKCRTHSSVKFTGLHRAAFIFQYLFMFYCCLLLRKALFFLFLGSNDFYANLHLPKHPVVSNDPLCLQGGFFSVSLFAFNNLAVSEAKLVLYMKSCVTLVLRPRCQRKTNFNLRHLAYIISTGFW